MLHTSSPSARLSARGIARVNNAPSKRTLPRARRDRPPASLVWQAALPSLLYASILCAAAQPCDNAARVSSH